MVTSWRSSSEHTTQSTQDYTHTLSGLVHRSSPQAAWLEPGSQQPQALLAQFMLKSTAIASKSGMQGLSNHADAAEVPATALAPQRKGSAERGYRSQPSSPARARRAASDHPQQYGLLNSAAAYGQLTVSAAGGSASPRGQTGTWHRPSGRPSSNPSPSRAPEHSAGVGPGQMGRTTPSRTAGSSMARGSAGGNQHSKYAYGEQQQFQQLGEFFTATSLKAPQRYDQSPYLKASNRSAQASTSGGLASPRSPRTKSSSNGINTSTNSRQQLSSLYSSSPEPMGRTKLGAISTGSKAAASQDGLRPSRGPGALVASNSRGNGAISNAASAAGAAQFRSNSSSSRYTSGANSSTSSRATTPQGSSGALSGQKQSLYQQQQQQLRQAQPQAQQQKQQQPQRQQAASQQPQMSPAASPFQQQPSQPYINTSGQLSGLLISTSSSTIAGRPQTAKGSSRAELRLDSATTAAAGTAGTSSSMTGLQMGINLDPQSWSTFLTLSTSAAAGQSTDPNGSSNNSSSSSRLPSNSLGSACTPAQQRQLFQQQQQQQVPQQPQQLQTSSGVSRNLQSQMLSDLGLGGTGTAAADTAAGTGASIRPSSSSSSTTPGGSGVYSQQPYSAAGSAGGQHQHSSGLLAASQQQQGAAAQSLQTAPAAASSSSSSGGGGSASRPGSSPGGRSILQQTACTAAPPDINTHQQHQQQQQPAAHSGPLREHSTGLSTTAAAAAGVSAGFRSSNSDECPPSPAAAPVAVPGPLHAGLMRPRSANNLAQLAAAQQPPAVLIQQQQQQVGAASSPQQSSYLQTLQQQQQQHGSSSPVSMRLPGQPVTPLSALRRRSNAAELAAAAAAAAAAACPAPAFAGIPPIALSALGGSDAAGSPVASYHQQSWGRTEDSLSLASPRTTILAAQQQLLQSPVQLRRMGSAEVGGSGASSPMLSRLQGDWGTLTAMSGFRGSGYGASLAESSTELSSPACHSTASWSSMGGAPPAHLISSMAGVLGSAGSSAGAAGAPVATTSAAGAGPGPSPLGIGSRPGSTAGTPQAAGNSSSTPYQSLGGGIGSFSSPAGARRTLNFGASSETVGQAVAPNSSTATGSSTVAAAGQPLGQAAALQMSQPVQAGPPSRAAELPAAAVRPDGQAGAAVNEAAGVSGQQSSTPVASHAGSRSGSFSSQQPGALQPSQQQAVQQQQQQSMEQRLSQLQQMHQAYKQQLQQAARLLDAAAGSTAATQQPAAAAAPGAAATGSETQTHTAAAAAAPGSRRESSSSAEVKGHGSLHGTSRGGVAPTWSIPAAQVQQQQQQQAPQQQQPQQQAARPSSSRPQQQQQQQQAEQQRREPPSSAMPAAAGARPSTSNTQTAAQSAAGAAATPPAQAASRPASAAAPAAPPTTAAQAGTAGASNTAATSGSSTAAAAGSASASAAVAAAAGASADAGSEPLLLPGYSVGAVVGEGGFCQVRLAVHHLSRRRVAVKVIDQTKLSDAAEARRMQREIRVLKRLNHPCVIRLFEVMEASSKLLLVMEYAPGGSLLDYVRSRKRLGEAEAAYFLQQILTGLQYCHDNEVVHRDIKLENILLDSNRSMKLIDFGLAAFYAPGKKLRVHCGSPSYAAPEIVARKLYEGPPVDVWSLGVVLFAMLAGFLPFHSPTGNKQELCQKIMAGTFNTPDWLSPGARDLLGRMLTVDPEARITLADAAQHPWTRGSGMLWEMPSSHCYILPMVQAGNSSSSSSFRSSSGSDGPQHQQGGSSSQGSRISAGGEQEGQVAAQASILEELEGHGYTRAAVVRYLAAGETNYITASYYLLSEARQEAAQKLLPQKPWPFQPVVVNNRSSGSSRSRAASSAAGAAGPPRPASGAGANSSRPASGTAAAGTAAAGAYSSSSRPATAVAVSS